MNFCHVRIRHETINRIREIHSYEVPEVVVLDISQGNPDYMQWIEEVTR